MKILNKLSLRMRVTLLSGLVLLLCSVLLMVGATYNARLQYNGIACENGTFTIVPQVTAIQEGTYSSNTQIDLKKAVGPTLTAARKQFDTINLVILGAVSVLGMGLIYIVGGRSLEPIHQLSHKISSITENDLRYRIPNEDRKDEVGVLERAFNTMLDRLETSFVKQKRFSANVAHELKTPLATIAAGIQVLNLDETPTLSECRETLATVERSTKRLIGVIDNLMCLYDEGEKGAEETVVLEDMFHSVCDELQPIFQEKNIQAEINCQVHDIVCSPSLIYRACFNLIENAAKYNQDGGKIKIQTVAEDSVWKVIVSDTGMGIPQDEIPHIFEPFYRVNKSRSRKTGGAGLGLSIVKAMIEKHGWEITVNSTLGVGSTFTITFSAMDSLPSL
jgi:signal transduction histidine kinase